MGKQKFLVHLVEKHFVSEPNESMRKVVKQAIEDVNISQFKVSVSDLEIRCERSSCKRTFSTVFANRSRRGFADHFDQSGVRTGSEKSSSNIIVSR